MSEDTTRPPSIVAPGDGAPITESELHAYVDGQLTPERRDEVERLLAARPEERQRVEQWREQNQRLRELLGPVLSEPVPPRLAPPRLRAWPAWRSLAAGLALAVASAGAAWFVRGALDAGEAARLARAAPAGELSGFARRAAVAHAVYSKDQRRPVEVAADQEQQLVTWLSKRLGTAVHAPRLAGVGYELVGGRLLPGDSGPVAQFMYQDAAGQRLTLYVTHEAPQPSGRDTAFRFGRDGAVNVFYWVDRGFGYALSGAIERPELMRVSQEVYRQLTSG
jgi:anti-sigma factor RsiW